MSYREAQQWASFIQSNGPLSHTRRLEAMIAKVCWVIQAVHGGKLDISDFLPDYDQSVEDEPEATLEQFAAILRMARVK
ncbi:phage tail assembly protein T [Azorhizophilus paspali]|uniref:Minor tail T domain-containing protein n=2 Tax=Azorhizophilus paspali TaxID=69963 RepID=A0ABV6SMF9_AZOPA